MIVLLTKIWKGKDGKRYEKQQRRWEKPNKNYMKLSGCSYTYFICAATVKIPYTQSQWKHQERKRPKKDHGGQAGIKATWFEAIKVGNRSKMVLCRDPKSVMMF